MSELTPYAGSGAAAKLVQWAEAASAAQALAEQLCRTAFVPESFRLAAGESDDVRRDNAIRVGNATAALLLGAELGLDPIASLRALYVIRGQVAVYARMKLALLLSRGHRVWTESESDEEIVVAGHRKDDPEHIQRVSWNVDRARRAGFARNDLYRTNPRAMLFARASSELASRLAPDVLAGIPEETAEELGARVAAPAEIPGAPVTVQRSPRPTQAPRRALTPIPAEPTTPRAPASSPATHARALARARQEKRPEPEPPTTPDEPTAEPLPVELPEEEPKMTGAQRAMMHSLFRAQGWDQNTYHDFVRKQLGKPELKKTTEMTVTEASFIIDLLQEIAGENHDDEVAH